MIALTIALSAALAGPTQLSESLHVALSAHEPPSCQAVFDMGEAEVVRDALLELSRPELMPPAVPMRAVACNLSQRPDDPVVLAAAGRWVAAESTPGFALVVAHHLDRVPAAPAGELGRALVERMAAEPRLELHLRPVLLASEHPRVVALVPTTP